MTDEPFDHKNEGKSDAYRLIADIIDNAEILSNGNIHSLCDERERRGQLQRVWPDIYPASLQDKPVPERRWLVPDWVPDGVVTLLTGDGGTGKSLLALQLATCAATGKPFLGMEMAARKALFLSAEDDADELHRRQAAICREMGIDFADLDDRLVWRVIAGGDTLLAAYDEKRKQLKPTPALTDLEAYCIENGVQLVVVDTAADTFGGLEIDRQQVTRYIRLLENIARKMKGAVVLLAHPSLDGMRSRTGISGSTAWRNAVRSAIYLHRPDEGADDDYDLSDIRILERTKGNFARAGNELRLRYDRGHFVADGGNSTGPAIDVISTEVRVMRAISTFLGRGVRLSPAPTAPTGAAAMLTGTPDCAGMKRNQIKNAINQLLSSGQLEVRRTGRPSNNKQVLVPSDWPRLEDEMRGKEA